MRRWPRIPHPDGILCEGFGGEASEANEEKHVFRVKVDLGDGVSRLQCKDVFVVQKEDRSAAKELPGEGKLRSTSVPGANDGLLRGVAFSSAAMLDD